LKLQFDRIGVPAGDIPLDSKVIATHNYKVDKQGKIDGKGHPKRDVVEWLLPPLWPWKVIMLPARGPRPKLKGETVLSLRLMDDVQIPQLAQTYGPGWHFFGHPQNESYDDARLNAPRPQLALRPAPQTAAQASYAEYVTRDVSTQDSLTASPGMPMFVLNNGTVLSVSGYGYQDSRISYSLAGGGSGVVSTADVDWSATTRLNAKRGVRVTLHAGHVSAATPGM
jgi:hypothetical protein